MQRNKYYVRKYHTLRGIYTVLVKKGTKYLSVVLWDNGCPTLKKRLPLKEAKYLDYLTPSKSPAEMAEQMLRVAEDRMSKGCVSFLKEAAKQQDNVETNLMMRVK